MHLEETGFDPLAEERPSFLKLGSRFLQCLLVLTVIPAAFIAWRPPYAELASKKAAVVGLEARKQELEEEVARKKEKLELIKTDSAYLEVVARDLLESQKEGETIVFFKNK